MTSMGRVAVRGATRWSLLLALASDGGGGSAPTPPPVQAAQLVVTVAGVPAGAQAAVTISGAATQAGITATTTLSNLAPGTYTIAASNVVSAGSVFAPQTIAEYVTATAGGVASATVTYAIVRIGLQAVVANLDMPLWLTAPAGDAVCSSSNVRVACGS